MTAPSGTQSEPTPWALAVCLALAAPFLLLLALAVPALHARKLQPSPPVRTGLDELGIPVPWYAAWWTVVLVAFAAVCLGVAALLVWRRPRERGAWVTAVFLVALGSANAPVMEALVWQRPWLAPVATVAFQVFLACLLLFLFTFPDGRFRPRWSWVAVAVAVVGLVVARGSVGTPMTDGVFWALLAALGGGLAAQVHRYRSVSTPLQRAQTRWVTAAAAVAVAAQLLFPMLESVPALTRPGPGAALLDMASPAGISLAFSLIPVALAVAFLRAGLWGLDVVVNRALVYGALTTGLLVLYLVVAGALGRSFGAPGDAGGSVFAAGLVALAFAPLRARIQRGVNRLMYGQRDEPYLVLTGLGRRLEDTIAPRAVLQTIADTVSSALRSPYVAVVLHDRDGGSTVAAEAGEAVAGVAALPLVHRHRTVGELRVAPRSTDEAFNPADRALLDDIGRQAGAAVHAVLLAEELQQSRARLVTAREEERRRLRRDLHDGLGPALASMTMQAETARELMGRQPEVTDRILADLVEQLQASTADIRRLVYDLRPPVLDDLGLAAALRLFLERSGSSRVRPVLDLPEALPPMSAATEVAVYRIVQEAVANVLRHAHATTCAVSLREEGGTVLVEVADDGTGVGDHVTEGVGLRSMRERTDELGGECTVTSAPAAGTVVRVRFPCSPSVGTVG